ncbi:unnamed protein product [Ectocarpus fasciculatus]
MLFWHSIDSLQRPIAKEGGAKKKVTLEHQKTWNKEHGAIHRHTIQAKRTRHAQYSNARHITSCSSRTHPRSRRLERKNQPLVAGAP